MRKFPPLQLVLMLVLILELIEPTPKSENNNIKVSSQFTIALSQLSWHKLPGIVSWKINLKPNQTKNSDLVLNM